MADFKEAELRNAARHVVSLLRSALAEARGSVPAVSTADEVQVQGQQASGSRQQVDMQEQTAPCNQEQPARRHVQQQRTFGFSGTCGSVEQSMTRSFPGLFKPRKNSTPSPKRKAARSTPVQFYLLNQFVERTPKMSTELLLLQAGLGRRTVTIPEDGQHSEISSLLLQMYPKMASLQGAWMLYKAVGGSGQRKLNVVQPDEEGYTGAYIIKALGGRGGCLYIMPLQGTLDMSPLPFTSREFDRMPKAQCATCHVDMPIQLLALHAQKCEPDTGSRLNSLPDVFSDVEASCDLTEMDSERCAVDEPDSRPAVVVKVSCPLCCDAYPEDCIKEHASTCEGRYEEPRVNSDLQVDQDITNENRQEPYSLADAVCKVKDKIDPQAIFSICVTREEIFHRGLKQWKRQKKATPINPLRVSFLGEAGIDNGALRKEFLTEMMAGIETNLFEGSSAGKTPKYSIMDYQNDNFKIAGEVIAVSIAQDGPPPNFFHEWSYTFISMGEFDKDQLSETDVTDPELLDLISKVETSDKAALIDLLERILACGYMGPVTCDKKASIVSAIVLHSRVRVLPMLQQICTGLKLYGLHDMIKQNPAIFQPLFVPGHLDKPDADFLAMALSPLLSEPGSLKRHKELRIVNFLQDFIQSMDDEGMLVSVASIKDWSSLISS
uniref:Uncharacterized LOC111188455 n=1 Tax=Astyanax mexicanus TaxID=7994 RepID=A0A3B1JVC3_ASTMX